MEKHVAVLGVIYLVFGILTIVIAIWLSNVEEPLGMAPDIATIIAYILIILALPGIAAGIGLLKKRRWGRILGLVVGFLNLVDFPVGSALGVYAIWVLMNDESDAVFRQREVSTGA